jgi:hypothetical protein
MVFESHILGRSRTVDIGMLFIWFTKCVASSSGGAVVDSDVARDYIRAKSHSPAAARSLPTEEVGFILEDLSGLRAPRTFEIIPA